MVVIITVVEQKTYKQKSIFQNPILSSVSASWIYRTSPGYCEFPIDWVFYIEVMRKKFLSLRKLDEENAI